MTFSCLEIFFELKYHQIGNCFKCCLIYVKINLCSNLRYVTNKQRSHMNSFFLNLFSIFSQIIILFYSNTYSYQHHLLLWAHTLH